MAITQKSFGHLKDGREATLYTLTNASGAAVDITNYGGILVAIRVPDRDGKLGDVLLGCKSVEEYQPNDGYVGALIGRFGNRIAHGLCKLNGRELHLAQNDHGHHLHGGMNGFDKKLWDAKIENDQLVLSIVSPDGEENYPGNLSVTVTYSFSDANALSIHYHATTDQDTIINLTNHAYFNLEGEGASTTADHIMQIFAGAFIPTDDDSIPTGEIRSVEGTPFDFRTPVRIGDALAQETVCDQLRYGGGFDHNYCLDGNGMREAVRVTAPKTGRTMVVSTDQPGVQFYGGNFLNGTRIGKSGLPYPHRAAFCLETQVYPDAINHPNFPSPILCAGETFDSTTVYRFE